VKGAIGNNIFLMKNAAVEQEMTHGSRRLQELHVWCVAQYAVALLSAGRKDQALQFLQQVRSTFML
jgi:hypothetical protein